MLLADAAPVIEARARALREKLERLSAVRAARDKERLARQKTSEEITARRNVLAELLEKKQTERDVAATLARAAQRETAALAARASDLREMIGRLERLARIITPRLKPPPPAQGAPLAERPQAPKAAPFKPARSFAEARGKLRAPVVGRVVDGFGAEKPGGGVYEGVRYLASPSAIVTAPFEGSVVFARNFGPVGNLIMLDVGGGFHIALAGVGAFLAQEGQTVAAGEPIAAMTAGAETVLEFEIRKNGEPVNPALWLSQPTMEDASF
jgi:septal ring factor EnvC (AmiA/AmiB activator)